MTQRTPRAAVTRYCGQQLERGAAIILARHEGVSLLTDGVTIMDATGREPKLDDPRGTVKGETLSGCYWSHMCPNWREAEQRYAETASLWTEHAAMTDGIELTPIDVYTYVAGAPVMIFAAPGGRHVLVGMDRLKLVFRDPRELASDWRSEAVDLMASGAVRFRLDGKMVAAVMPFGHAGYKREAGAYTARDVLFTDCLCCGHVAPEGAVSA